MHTLRESRDAFINEVERAVVGRREAIQIMFKAILCGGHVLLEDVPGVGKTLLVRAIARALDCSFHRIQFTSDMFPSDITGVSVLNSNDHQFEFKPGPLFTPLLLADEINRASPKTQSALLEAMEEKKVTVDGKTYDLPDPFIVMATQNPLESEGTYVLPEAQMDRFLFRYRLGYPARKAEMDMLEKLQDSAPLDRVQPVMKLEQLLDMQRAVGEVYVDASVKAYIVSLSEATRYDQRLRLGASPRASIALMKAAQCEAWFSDRDYVIPDDVKAMFALTYSHRILLHDQYAAPETAAVDVLRDIVKKVEVPAFGGVSA